VKYKVNPDIIFEKFFYIYNVNRKPTLFLLFLITSVKLFAWGPRGHKIVAQIAMKYMDQAVIDSVNSYLQDVSIVKAAYWMDEVKMNITYDFMEPWHYVNIPKDKTYVSTAQPNIVNVLEKLITTLKYTPSRKREDAKLSLKVLLHLVGDIHQPLHCGYGTDKGGNEVKLRFFYKSTDLHSVWDTEILEYQGISADDCINMISNLSEKDIRAMQEINVIKWMEESRNLLSHVYDFKGSKVAEDYVDRNTPLIKMQLVKAGLRLAAVLNQTFKKQ
jgi:hypothetical protein